MSMNEQARLLPLVHADIGRSVQQSLLEDSQFSANELLRLRQESENPAIANFIATMALSEIIRTGDRDSGEAVVTVGVLVYRLLESQAEVDRLPQVQ